VRVAIATALLVAVVPAAAQAARPDLKVTSISLGAGTATAGSKVKVGDATRNAGGAAARRSTTTYYLSADRRKSRSDFKIAGRKVARLRRRGLSRGAATARIPPSLTPGSWSVIACADSARRIRESNERNNCRASASSLIVRGDTPQNGVQPVIGGCRIFPADNPWNRDISHDPVDPMSDTYIRYMGSSPGADWNLRQDWGTSEEPFYGIPWVVVPASQPLLPISFSPDAAPDESDKGPFPFPRDIPIEGGSPDNPSPMDGDRHAIALQQGGDCTLYETFATTRTGSGFEVYSAAKFDLGSNATRPPTWTSADAAGLPIFPGLAKYDEVAAGAIRHALRFTVPRVQKSWVAPATHYGTQENACYPPYGARVRLKSSFDLNRLTGQARVFGEALAKYGLMLADQGSAGYISGTSDAGWNMDELHELRDIHGSDLEVVATGPITPYRWSPPANASC
jgi:CARDB